MHYLIKFFDNAQPSKLRCVHIKVHQHIQLLLNLLAKMFKSVIKYKSVGSDFHSLISRAGVGGKNSNSNSVLLVN